MLEETSRHLSRVPFEKPFGTYLDGGGHDCVDGTSLWREEIEVFHGLTI